MEVLSDSEVEICDGNSQAAVSVLSEDSPSSVKSKSKTTSEVYQYVLEKDDGTFNCRICSEKRVKQIWATRSTSNFKKHLLAKHADQYAPKDATHLFAIAHSQELKPKILFCHCLVLTSYQNLLALSLSPVKSTVGWLILQ